MEPLTFSQTSAFQKLTHHANEVLKNTHLKQLLKDQDRNNQMVIENKNITFDFTHEKLTPETLKLLAELSEEANLPAKINKMFKGEKINTTEKRSVLHVALRANKDKEIMVDGENVVKAVNEIQDRIRGFSERVRNGKFRGYSGEELNTYVVIGIGGSYLGPEFVYEALRFEPICRSASKGKRLIFLANVDPLDFHRAVDNIDFKRTLFIINSKTFTTAETMLNARTARNWLLEKYASSVTDFNSETENKIVTHHMCAVSTFLKGTAEFGISDENVFGFWDWVGGRYSVSSAVGVLPLSLYYGFENVERFLRGAESIDDHFVENAKKPLENIPLLLGLIGFFNTSILNCPSRAILPYSQALSRFVPHIQQLDMESNGKSVTLEGKRLAEPCGPIIFGEPGTNGQHSFYQLIHQGRKIPCEFIGFIKSQTPVIIPKEQVDNHDELMSNYFAQPDALAYGKDVEELKKEGVAESLYGHKTFEGDRPSLSFLFEKLDAFSCGQLLAIYEHRVAVEGFLYGINSFDQWGVELGKVLAKDVRTVFTNDKQKAPVSLENFNSATAGLLKKYLENKLH